METIEKWNETGEVNRSDPIININTICYNTGNRQNVAKQNQMYGNKQSQNPYITINDNSFIMAWPWFDYYNLLDNDSELLSTFLT